MNGFGIFCFGMAVVMCSFCAISVAACMNDICPWDEVPFIIISLVLTILFAGLRLAV